MENLLFTFNAVLPIIFLILTGYGIKCIGLLPESFFSQLNRLCFYVCLPAMLFYNVYNVTNISIIFQNWKIALFSIISIAFAFFVGFLTVYFFVKEPKQKGVVLQCVFRSNFAIIGIPLVSLLAKEQTIPLAIASVIAAVSIPFFNILATIALSVFIKTEDEKTNKNDGQALKIIKKILTNPLIISTFAGIFILILRNFIPTFTIKQNLPFLYNAIKMLSASASPIALLALGGGFSFHAIAKLKKQIFLGTFMRLVFIPAILLTLSYFLGFAKNEFPALIVLFGTPVAVSSVPMSAEMGGDTELAGQLVVWTTIFSAFTLFITIFICVNLGLLG